MVEIAIVQHPPVLLDREATLARAVELVAEAAQHGAGLVIFPETYVPGYPTWIWRLRPGSDAKLISEIHARLIANAIDLKTDQLGALQRAAEQHRVTVLVGVHERDAEFSRTTLYNTYVFIGADGRIVNRHRKLVPTNPERMVWGLGDGSGLSVVDSSCGRIGALICWENYMPLARYTLYAQGIELYVAPTWDYGEGWIGSLEHISREGRCWVAGSGCSLRGSDVPNDFPGRAELYPDADEWVNPGDSVIVAPGGKLVAGPLRKTHGILYGAIDLERVAGARRTLDVAGHYARPDVFELNVKRAGSSPIRLDPKRDD